MFFFAIYSHGDHLGHVTLTIYINFHEYSTRRLALIGQAVSEKKIFDYYGYIYVYCPGVGADLLLVSFFRIINIQSISSFP